jgi:SPP1 gp7 family putative phage head morphogenesis protein
MTHPTINLAKPVDPTRTGMLRDQATREIRRRFSILKRRIREYLLTNHPRPITEDVNDRIQAITQWLDHAIIREIHSPLTSADTTISPERLKRLQGSNQWWMYYVSQAYIRGVERSFDDVHRSTRTLRDPLPHAQSKADFIRSLLVSSAKPSIPSSSITDNARRLNPQIRDALGRYISQRVLNLAMRLESELQSVTTVMSQRIARELIDGINRQLLPSQIASNIVKTVDLTQNRAEMIARTEMIRAFSEGQLDAMERLGVGTVYATVEWVVTSDQTSCPRCRSMEGRTFSIKDARGLIPLHPFCRCCWNPVSSPVRNINTSSSSFLPLANAVSVFSQVINAKDPLGHGSERRGRHLKSSDRDRLASEVKSSGMDVKVGSGVLQLAQKIFGRSMTKKEIAGMVAAQPGSKTYLSSLGDRLSVVTENKEYGSVREIFRDADGKLVCANGELNVRNKGRGLGTKIFSEQVSALVDAGFDRITCWATKGTEFNGYYTWARLGYDGKIPQTTSSSLARDKGLPKELRYPETVHDLISRPGGMDAWSQHGDTFSATFDLNKGSNSRKILDAYITEKSKSVVINQETSNRPHNEDPDISPEEDKILDIVWQRVISGEITINAKDPLGHGSEKTGVHPRDQLGQSVKADASKIQQDKDKRKTSASDTPKPAQSSTPQTTSVEDTAKNRPTRPDERHNDEEGNPIRPPALEWKDPPPKKGKKGGGKPERKTGDESQTAVGDAGEALATQIGFRNILPEGQRSHKPGEVKEKGSTIDTEFNHSGRAYEIKLCNDTATEYRLKAKKEEKDAKEEYARQNNLTAHVMVAVRETETGTVHFYAGKEPGLIGAEVSSKKYDYVGSVKDPDFKQ